MYTPVPSHFLSEAMPSLEGTAIKLYLTLCARCWSARTSTVEIRTHAVARQLSVTPRAIQKSMIQLESAGLIRRRPKKQRCSPTILDILNFPIRSTPHTLNEWIACITREPFESRRITEGLVHELRKAAGAPDEAIIATLRSLIQSGHFYEADNFPVPLIATAVRRRVA